MPPPHCDIAAIDVAIAGMGATGVAIAGMSGAAVACRRGNRGNIGTRH